ncbi:MAG: hypothetical protein GKR87_10895 [Kiritimatiellae bacterium]|nr:hypothetical protein [Kiritimatiellia bacterium]
MPNLKVNVSYDIQEEHKNWLESMATQYHLPNASKALRILLDYAIAEGDKDAVFTTIRCRHCD